MSKNWISSEGYDEKYVLDYLQRKGVGFETTTDSEGKSKTKYIFLESGQLGTKALGMVDYLVNYHHYRLIIKGSREGK